MKKLVYNKTTKFFVAIVREDIPIAEEYDYVLSEELPEDIDTTYKYLDGNWVHSPQIASQDDIISNQWNFVKSERNKKLFETDWTQLPDVVLRNKEAWATYRQALRDITTQSDPYNIVWPTPPG